MTARTVRVGLLVIVGVLCAAVGLAAVDPDGRTRGSFDPRGEALDDLAERMAAERRSLERRDLTLTDRERELRAVELRLAERANELTALRASIDALRAEIDVDHAARVQAVTKAVEAMKPSAGAAMISELDFALSVEVVRGMNRGKAGKLLAALAPELAARITEGLAGPGGAVGRVPRPTTAPGPAPVPSGS